MSNVLLLMNAVKKTLNVKPGAEYKTNSRDSGEGYTRQSSMEQRLNIAHYKYQNGKFPDHSDADYYFGVQFERRHRQCIWYASILLKSQYYIYFQYG